MVIGANIKNDGKEYFAWVDIAKTICIYLVILGHGRLVDPEIQKYIYAFHMPLFFFLSGYLYRHRNFVETIKHDWVRLLIPYFLMNFVLLAYTLLVEYIHGIFSINNMFSHIIPIFLGLGHETEIYSPVCTTGWFIIALFLIHIIMSLFENMDIVKGVVISITSIFIVFLCKLNGIQFNVPILSAMCALPFFIGGLISKKVTLPQRNTYSFVIGIILFICMIALTYNNTKVDVNTVKFGNNILIFYISAFCGTFGMCLICKSLRIKWGGVFHLYSQGTILILGFNLLFISWIKSIYYSIFPALSMNSFVGAVLALVIFLSFYPLILFCKKYCPIILGLRK